MPARWPISRTPQGRPASQPPKSRSRRSDGAKSGVCRTPTSWIEPPWKAILSNKGILPLLWEMFADHPNLLPAYFEDDPNAARLGASFVRKPLYSREGANIALVSAAHTPVGQEAPP